jgi:polysaccharide biosynthesis PFTS motif protein
MYIPFITKLVKKKYRSKIRLRYKGYKHLKSEGRLELLRQLQDILTKTKFNNTSLFKSFFHQANFDIELSIRQYFTARILGLSFNRSILYSIGTNQSLSHPLPKEWRVALINHGIKVNNFNSALLWYIYGFFHWGRGVISELKNIYFLLKKQPNLGKYAYFLDLNELNISSNPNRHNIVNWYLRWKNRNIEINSICHSVAVSPDFKLGKVDIIHTHFLPKLIRNNLLKYIVFFIYEVIYSFICLFFKPAYGYLFREFMQFKRVDLANDSDLACDYLFNTSAPYYRPVWTYIAEKKGSRIIFYDYSTSRANFKTKNRYPIANPWHLMNWPHYLVWNEFHAKSIRNSGQHNPIIENVGHIWFSSGGNASEIPPDSIAVFDDEPFRPTENMTKGYAEDYYTFKTSNQFMSDIQSVLEEIDMNMVHKRKRIHKAAHKSYIRRIRQLNKESNYIQIDPNADPLQVIQKTKACISMPFTSPAVIAKQEGKPSVYYDPTDIIQKDDIAAHGVKVLNGIGELKVWIKSIENKIVYE